jgi:regulator of protease activity HflC (stomatin/prohibitin superfamily)
MIKETPVQAMPGLPVLLGTLAGFVVTVICFIASAANEVVAAAVFFALLWAINLVAMFGLFTVAPNEAKVLQLFGRYVGTVRDAGLKWANPFYSKRKISTRVRNFESNKLKVNEQDGSPIEIAAVVVWRVVDTAEAAFEVDNYENYVHVQSESALRNLATQHPYDAHDDTTKLSLRGNTAEVAEQLKAEIQARLSKAGVEVIEARITHLAYAAEIAAVMLRRQQANAIIAARQRIVEGAVGMVDMALELLQKKNVVTLDEERKAAMVSNLLVVLCGEHDTTPVINTGTIYQ